MSILKTQFNLIILSLAFATSVSISQSIKKIKVVDKENTIAKIAPRFELETTNAKVAEDSVLNIYVENGYFSAKIESVKIKDKTLFIYVNEGKRYVVEDVDVSGNEAVGKEKILEKFGVKPGDGFSSEKIKRGIGNILELYANLGYPLASVQIGGIEIKENPEAVVKIKILINEGPLVKINEIKIEGNKITKPYVVVRETGIRKGEIYVDRKIKKIKSRLLKLGIFDFVSDPEIFVKDTLTGILIRVKESKTTSFDGVVGYLPGSDGGRGYFTGFLNIGVINIFGTGRKLKIRWESEGKGTQEIELKYFEPYVAGFPLNAFVSFYQRKQDSAFVVRVPKLDIEAFFPGGNLKAFFSISQKSVIPSATQEIGYVVPESKTFDLGTGLNYDSRDEIEFPSTGVFFKTSYSLGVKIFTKPRSGKTSVRKFSGSIEFYKRFRWFYSGVFAFKFNYFIVSGGIDEADVLRIGGSKTIRGYRENEFAVTRAIWSNFEHRVWVGEKSYAFLFFDAGYLFRPVIKPRFLYKFEAFRAGYGLGVRFKTGIGIVSLSYALGRGDSFKTGKIHIGVESQF